MKKKKWHLPICLFGMLVLLLTIGNPIAVRAEETTDIVASGDEEGMKWKLSTMGVLTISGCTTSCPWESYFSSENFSEYSITEVIIEEGVTSIEDFTFYDCPTIQKVSLPTSLESISYNAFGGCTALTSIEIPQNVTDIDVGAFDNCSNLREINVHEDNEKYKSIDGILYIDYNVEHTLYKCPEGYEGILDIPSNTTKIYAYYSSAAIKNCKKITKVVIPANILDNVEGYRLLDNFSGCDSLCSFSVSGESSDQYTTYQIVDGALYKVWKGRVALLKYPSGLSECNLWDECTEIYYDAFCGCEKLIEVILPEGITSIYEYGFRNCINIKQIKLPLSLETLGCAVFDYCKSLEEVIIPDNVTTIYNVFRSCYALKNVEFGKGVTAIDVRTFEGCSSLETVTMSANVTEIKIMAFLGSSPEDIYYGGTEEQWKTIVIGEWENDALNRATIHYLGTNVESISLNKTEELCIGGSKTLAVTFLPENASYKAISWETSDANIATVENGVVTAVAPGTVTITATSLDTGCTATCLVEIPESVYGDANGDGVVNTKDIIRIRRYVAAKDPVTGESTVEVSEGADVNGDGVINTKDIIRLRRHIAAKDPITGESSVVLGPAA